MKTVRDAIQTFRDRGILLAALVAPGLIGAALIPLRERLTAANVALVLVLVVVGVAATGNRAAALVAALSSALWFDVLFTVPYYSLSIERPDALVTTGLLLLVGLAVGQLSSWALGQRDAALRGRADVRRIHHAAALMADGAGDDRLTRSVARELSDLLDLRECRFDPGPADPLLAHIDQDGFVRWGQVIWGVGTLGLPTKGASLSAIGNGREVGAFTLKPLDGHPIDRERLLVAVALANQVGAALSLSAS